MDRPLKNPRLSQAEWSALLTHIQAHSPEMEKELVRKEHNLIEALAGLDSLEDLTSKHLTPPQTAAATTSVQSASNPASSAKATAAAGSLPNKPASASLPQSALPVRYKTSHQEYAPALNQNELVQALLEYQQRRREQPNRRRSSNIIPSSRDLAFPQTDFSPARAPQVQAEPKASPLSHHQKLGKLGNSRTSENTIPVLRSRPATSRSKDEHGDD